MANSEGEGEPLIDLGAESRGMQQEEWAVLSSVGTEASRSEAGNEAENILVTDFHRHRPSITPLSNFGLTHENPDTQAGISSREATSQGHGGNPFLAQYGEIDRREFSAHFQGEGRPQERHLGDDQHFRGLNSRNINRENTEVGGIPRYFGKPIMQPPQFDGSTNWDDYLVQFELISELNGWSPDTKALYLAAGLKGQARAILSELDAVRRRDFKELVTALGRRFGAASQTQLYKAILRNRIRQTGESIPQLAQEIKRLVMQAYPDAPFDMVETLAKDYFIDALGDADTRWRVYQSRPRMLADAVTVAVELDAFRTAEFKRGSLRRPVARVINAKYEEEKESKGDSDKEELLKQIRLLGENLNKTLTNTLIQLQGSIGQGATAQNVSSPVQGPRKDSVRSEGQGSQQNESGERQNWQGGNRRLRQAGCWNCGDPGHFKRDCPQPNRSFGDRKVNQREAPKEADNQAPTPNQGNAQGPDLRAEGRQ